MNIHELRQPALQRDDLEVARALNNMPRLTADNPNFPLIERDVLAMAVVHRVADLLNARAALRRWHRRQTTLGVGIVMAHPQVLAAWADQRDSLAREGINLVEAEDDGRPLEAQARAWLNGLHDQADDDIRRLAGPDGGGHDPD